MTRGGVVLLLLGALTPAIALPAGAQSLPSAVEGKKDPTVSVTRFEILVAQPSPVDPDKIVGAVGRVALILIPKEGDDTSLGYLESTPGFTGPLWQESGWGAITTAALFVDRPLRHRIAIEFEQAYRIEGPSGSAMLTVALLAALNGHRLRERATMTGMIMPDGSLGAVGCVKEKLSGAKESRGVDRVVIPESLSSDRLRQLARALDLEIRWASDLHEAYRELVVDPATGRPAELPRITQSTGPMPQMAGVESYVEERAQIWLSVARGLKTRWDGRVTGLDQESRDRTQQLAARAAELLAAALDAKTRSRNSKAYERALDAIAHYYTIVRYAEGKAQQPQPDPSESGILAAPDRQIDAAAMQTLRASTEVRARSVTMGADASLLFDLHTAVGRYHGHLDLARRDWNTADGLARGGPGKPRDPERAESVRMRAFVHEARALVSALRAQDLAEMWPRIKDGMKRGAFAPQTLPTVARLLRVSTASRAKLLAGSGDLDASGGARAAAAGATAIADPEREAIAAAAGELAQIDQKDLGNLAASVELFVRASSVLARSYALAYTEDACSTRATATALQDPLIQKALDLARERAKEALTAAAERSVDAPVAYHNYRYAEELASGNQEDKLSALEAYWRAGAYARILVLLGPPLKPPP